jgi:hypothetical protein
VRFEFLGFVVRMLVLSIISPFVGDNGSLHGQDISSVGRESKLRGWEADGEAQGLSMNSI